MATLEKIRNKSKLLVIVVGFALFAFIIGGLLKNGSISFHESKEQILVIDGNATNYREFQAKVEELEEVYKIQSGTKVIPDELTSQIRESVYKSMVRNALMAEESKKIGFAVSKEELADLVMGENISPMIQQMPMFRNPETGQFDKNQLLKVLKYIQSDNSGLSPEAQDELLRFNNFWLFWEQSIKNQKMEDKFSSLIARAVVSNNLDTKANFEATKTNVDFNYAAKLYSSIPDDKVSVSDAEIKDLYNQRKHQYKQDESQVISYIMVDIVPNDDDFNKVREELEKIRPALISDTNVVTIVNQNSDVPYQDAFVAESAVRFDLKEFVKTASIGDVTSPTLTGATYSITKLQAKTVAADSVKINQIMLSGPTKETIARMGDSLIAVVKGGTPFADMARSISKGATNGDMGWTTEARLLADAGEKFKNGIFNAPLNTLLIVESSQGTHLVEITDRTAPVEKYKLADIQVSVSPSTKTRKDLYNNLSQFLANNSNVDSLQSAATKSGYNCHSGMVIRKNEEYLQGVLKSRPVIRWAFENEPGTISDIFECENKFVAAGVEKNLEKGYRSLEDVADILKRELLNDKKAEKIISEVKPKSYQAISQYAQDFNSTVQNVQFVNFATPTISGIGQEPVLNARAVLAEKGKISEPIKGKAGVYVIEVTAISSNNSKFELAPQKESLNATGGSRVAYQAINTLIENADIKDNRINFY